MIIDMSFKHMDSTDAIKAHAREKSEKLERYFDGKIHVTWNFTVEKLEHVAHLHLVGKNMNDFCEARTSDLYASIEEAVHKMERQLRKHKEIVKNKHHHDAREAITENAGNE